MNPHRTRNHGSIEHRESIKRMLQKRNVANRKRTLQGKLQKIAVQLQKFAIDYSMNWKTHGADMDAIRAFKSKEVYSSGANHESGSKFKFRSDGKSLFLHDYEVARHHKDGIEVSNAGYDSPLTYKTHQALGINSKGSEKHPKGLITLGTKEMDKNSGEWTLINHNDISEEPIIPESMKKNQKARADGTFVERKKPKRETAEQASFRERATKKELKEQGLDRGHPLSTVNIQKTDQRLINAITGLNTSLPTDKRGNEAHHLLEYSGDGGVGKKLEKNKDPRKAGNSKMIPKDYHKFISNFQKSSPKQNLKRLRQMDSKIRQLKGKLQKIAAVGLPDNFGKDPEEKKNFEIKVKGGPKGITKNPTNEKFYKQFPRKVGNGLRKIELGGIDMSTNPLITFKPKKIQQNKGVSTLTKARSFYIKKRGDITKGAPVKGHIKDPSGIHKLDKGEDVIADNSLKNELKKENRLFKKTGKLQARLQKIATDINRSPVNNTMSKSDEIINSFGNSGLSIEGVDGIYDTKNHKVLDGYNQEDISRIRDIYGEGVFIGTNSETDTRDGPNTNDLERTRKELQSIEDKGGLPALGFDSTKGGSLEALNVAITDSKEKVMDALYDTQWGTYIISPNNSSEIVNNPNYTDINK